jgi:hypothetical protein
VIRITSGGIVMRASTKLGHLVGAAVLASLSITTAEVRAQGAADELKLEEVTVTARKREESLQDVPLSITAFSAEAIEKAGIYDVRDLVRLSPNVVLQTTGGNGTGRFMPNLTFRGLQPSVPLPRSQTGAVFVDGNYVLGGVNAVNTNDVERVEVLRGPQNTYFGRNTFAGAINFLTRNPGTKSAPSSICRLRRVPIMPSTGASKARSRIGSPVACKLRLATRAGTTKPSTAGASATRARPRSRPRFTRNPPKRCGCGCVPPINATMTARVKSSTSCRPHWVIPAALVSSTRVTTSPAPNAASTSRCRIFAARSRR